MCGGVFCLSWLHKYDISRIHHTDIHKHYLCWIRICLKSSTFWMPLCQNMCLCIRDAGIMLCICLTIEHPKYAQSCTLFICMPSLNPLSIMWLSVLIVSCLLHNPLELSSKDQTIWTGLEFALINAVPVSVHFNEIASLEPMLWRWKLLWLTSDVISFILQADTESCSSVSIGFVSSLLWGKLTDWLYPNFFFPEFFLHYSLHFFFLGCLDSSWEISRLE